ncbi:MAG TPA: DinB family protein [Gemmatimonadaceae bacterium]|nr:DinB family protein [Gemmatimonadaceae bacterium]
MPTMTPAPLRSRPAADEHLPYYERYIALVPEGDVLATLEEQVRETVALLAGLDEQEAAYRYAPGKWSVKEVVGHVSDTERVFGYRALCAARGEAAALPSMEQDDYVANGNFDARTLGSILDELTAVRQGTLALFRSMDDAVLARRVIASGAPVTARALAWMIAGHERHHQRGLREHYLTR